MVDFATARRNMVEGQIRPADVTDLRIQSAMLDVPRERFVPNPELAYLDIDIPLAEGAQARRMLKPVVIGRLLQALAPASQERALDVAGGNGYSAALLASLSGEVIAVEDDLALVKQAQKNLGSHVKVVAGPLNLGWPGGGPYDVILLNGATEIVPESLFSQLKDGGRLACVLGTGRAGRAMLYLRSGSEVSGRPLFDAAAPLLPGFAKTPEFTF
jgi:protein-L-isoaspartate(D-aspartate) O-methyltransferase